MFILCLNCGSSSVKFRLYDWKTRVTLASGVVERVGASGSFCEVEIPGRQKIKIKQDCNNHKDAISLALNSLTDKDSGVIQSLGCIKGVGHRVVHGGEKFKSSVVITNEVLNAFKELADLAPLHNPPNIAGIEAAQELMPDIKHMAIMDTAWHQTMPEHVFTYALPYEWYEKYGIRRYGFHGTSLLYVAKRAAVLLGKNPFKCNLVICHIGNGVSINAVKNGCSYDTSMGFTPLEGMVMGTRGGDHDVAIDLYIMEKEGKTPKEMNTILNKQSGLLGISGKSNDMRDLIEASGNGDSRSKLALEIDTYRLKKYIGQYMFALGTVDAIIFTAGVGEMSSLVRQKALDGLENFGIVYDKRKNNLARTRNMECDISSKESKVKIFVIPTDEERVLIEDTVTLMDGSYDEHTNFTYGFQKSGYMNNMHCSDFVEESTENPELLDVMAKHMKTLMKMKFE